MDFPTMTGFLAEIPLLFAQDAASGGIWSLLLPLAPIPFLYYFLVFMPQQQQEKKRRAMIDGLKKNDKVLTNGGIYATVISVDSTNDRVVLRVDDEKGVRMAFTKSSVARVLELSAEKSTEST
jgi:preprotein translocase subunit YajC